MNENFTEAEVYEVMGIEPETPPETPPEETQVETPAENPSETPPETPPEEPVQEPKPEQTPEENAAWAARRRKWAEREQRAVEEASQARVDQVYAEIFKNQVNPFTGQPINSEAAYRAFMQAKEQQAAQEQMQKAGIDPKVLQAMVDRQVAPFKQQMEAAQLSAIQEKARTANARMEAALQSELLKVTAMDPAIKTLEDIRKMPTASKVNEYVQMGLGLEDAFYLANRKEVDERRMAAARAATQEQLAGKGHLNPVGSVPGKTPYQVSQKEMEMYRAFNPDATDAEIRAAYEAEHKN